MSSLILPFDCETGGLVKETSDLLTAYFGIFDENFNKIDELDLKVKPDGGRLPITEAGALRANGIDIAKHMADPETITYSEAKEKLVAFLKKHLKKNGRYSNLVPLGHNVPFDIGYVQQYILSPEEWQSMIHYGILDTKSYAELFKRAGWLPPNVGTLTSCVEALGVAKRNAHNAKEDTLMCVDVFRAMLQMMKTNKGGSGQTQDLISLLEEM